MGSMSDRCIEKTVLLTLDLPQGQEWAWLADCNVLVLSSALDAEGQERAISEAQDTWRRTMLRSVPSPAA